MAGAADGVGATRRQARERALELLYECETKEAAAEEVLAEYPLDPDPYTADVVTGVGGHCEELDALIGKFAKGWAVHRMPAVDRTVLRMAVFELLYRPDVPAAVIISEAVDLARSFSTEESGRFVNGVLGRIATEVRP